MRIYSSTCESTHRRGGYVLVLFVIFLTALMGVTGLIIDLGLMMVNYRKAQNAADSGAFAGAVELSNGNTSSVVSEATRFVTTQNGATVPTALPPKVGPRTGPYSGNANFVEVYADATFDTSFLHLLGYASTQTVQGASRRRLAVCPNQAEAALVLDKNSPSALSVSGNGTFSVTGGPVYVNSTSSTAVQVSHNATLSAPAIDLVGGDSGSNGTLGTITPVTATLADPLAYLPVPTGLTSRSLSGGGSQTIQPGIYTGGINWTGGTLTMSPGIYYMNGGGFQVSGQGSVTGSGVMIYNAPNSSTDVISITGKGNVDITPPTSGTYEGLTFFQARPSTNPITVSGNGGTLEIGGTIYAAGASFSVSGSGKGTTTVGQVISDKLSSAGNGTIDVAFNGTTTALTPVVFLVE